MRGLPPAELADLIKATITYEATHHAFVTRYREPIIGFLAADDPRFAKLSQWTQIKHWMPADLLPDAQSVVVFFLPFAPEIAHANARDEEPVALEWAIAYQDTNTLIGEITTLLGEVLSQHGIRSAAQPATGNFKQSELRSPWSHKSLAVMAGIGSFGLHQLVITDAGCAGRLGSLVIDAKLPAVQPVPKERCEYFEFGTCIACLEACPVNAISEDQPLDRRACWQQCHKNGAGFVDIGKINVCGKCAVMGPCTLHSAV
ncbi:MAG: epoxyqueuosine reductase [Anaerolineales bacterium]|jgi:epoxyqueuosine reductase QueG